MHVGQSLSSYVLYTPSPAPAPLEHQSGYFGTPVANNFPLDTESCINLGTDNKELSNVHEIAFSVGDCEMTHDGHHGTPLQRRCATRWGASLSEDAADLDLIGVKNRFDAWCEKVDDLDDSCQPATWSATVIDNRMIHGLQVIVWLCESLSMFG